MKFEGICPALKKSNGRLVAGFKAYGVPRSAIRVPVRVMEYVIPNTPSLFFNTFSEICIKGVGLIVQS
jgi:hypothetical protein